MLRVERWWNGQYGRLARRDVALFREDIAWRVEIREGGVDSNISASWTYDDEEAARAMLRRCLDSGGEDWRQFPP